MTSRQEEERLVEAQPAAKPNRKDKRSTDQFPTRAAMFISQVGSSDGKCMPV